MSSRGLSLLFAFCTVATPLARAQDPDALRSWRAERGESWQVVIDRNTRLAELVFGGRLEPAFAPVADAEFVAVAQDAVALSFALHGIDVATLTTDRVSFLPLAQFGSTDKVAVRFDQKVGRVPVHGGGFNVLFDTDGRALALQTTAIPAEELAAVESTPAIDASTASRLAVIAFENEAGVAPTYVSTAELVIARGENRSVSLAWRVSTLWRTAGAEPEGTVYYVGASDGSIVRREPAVHHADVTGQVFTLATPGTAPDAGYNPPVTMPASYVTLSSDQGSVVTDADGFFTFPGVSSVTGVSVRFIGPWVDVQNQGGADYSLDIPVLSGAGNTINLNTSVTQFVTAQANAHLGTSAFRDWIRAINPTDSTMDFQVLANVNAPQTCNASFDGFSTNYRIEGGGCVNSAYSTLIAHETGHWANVLYSTGNGNDGMGEGNADVWALYQYDTPIMGADFWGPDAHIRDARIANMYCGPCGACYGEVHEDGEVWMGAAWNIRANLKETHGSVMGGLIADNLFLGWMNAFDQTTIDAVIELQWLMLDDDDANLDNGTPNFVEIDQGFVAQGFPGLAPVVTNVTELADTTDETGPYPVSATITPISPPVVTATLHWRLFGTGAFNAVSMTPQGGDVFAGDIPGQPGTVSIEYYVSTVDSAGTMLSFPADAPGHTLRFLVIGGPPVFADDFETDQGWTVTDDPSLTSGTWQRADPNGTFAFGEPVAPEDDHTPAPGTMCYVTQNGAPGGLVGLSDVDGGPTWLTSPSFSLSGDAQVGYAYWFYTDGFPGNADTLLVEISNDDGASWQTAADHEYPCDGTGAEWIEHEFFVSEFLTPTSTMRLRFSTSDNPNGDITDAGVDDVVVHALATDPCTPIRYCSPATPNETGSSAQLDWSGSTSVASNDLVFTVGPLLPGNNGLIAYSPDAASTPLGNGTLCIGTTTLGFVIRLPGHVVTGSTMTHALDISSPPLPIGQITVGSTWNFQSWNRDFSPGGAGFNFSDALQITFCP